MTEPEPYRQYNLEWDGDRCVVCRFPVDDGVAVCDVCAEDDR